MAKTECYVVFIIGFIVMLFPIALSIYYYYENKSPEILDCQVLNCSECCAAVETIYNNKIYYGNFGVENCTKDAIVDCYLVNKKLLSHIKFNALSLIIMIITITFSVTSLIYSTLCIICTQA